MRKLYTLLLYVIMPFVLLRLFVRSRHMPAFAKRWRERFGYFTEPAQKKGIWLHAVSVGEVLAAVPFIKVLQAEYPNIPLTVTTGTATGSARVQSLFPSGVFHVFVPYDLPGSVARFLEQVQPQLAIIMETELWPNLLAACKKRNIPLLLANARLSERSMRGYQKIKPISLEMMQHLNVVAAHAAVDAEHFYQLGISPDKVVVTGSIKFDMPVPADIYDKARELRAKWGAKRLTMIAASTHEGEETKVLEAFAKARERIPQLLCMIVPRHPERFSHVTDLCRQKGYKVGLRAPQDNSEDTVSEAIDIFIGNTMGELLLFYAAADVAFVGGSLIERGGHNLLEPAALGIPVLSGPHLFNFVEISQKLSEANALWIVEDAAALAKAVIELLANPELHQQMIDAGKQVVAANRGALAKHMQLVAQLMEKDVRKEAAVV